MDKCPACNKRKTEKVKMHFYDYRRCLSCGHVYNCVDAKVMRQQYLRLRERYRRVYKEFIQNTLTSEHSDRRKSENRQRLFLLRRFADEPCDLLEMDCQDGSLERMIDSGYNYSGISLDKFYARHGSDKVRIGEAATLRSDERFDAILLVDYLEYTFDPYFELIKCLSRVRKKGVLIAKVPLNQDPSVRYTAAAHHFSEKGVRHMAKYITMDFEISTNLEEAVIALRP